MDTFEIPFTYKDINYNLPASLSVFGYSHCIRVTLPGFTVNFEPDDENLYRAVLPYGTAMPAIFDIGLLETISKAINGIMK